MSSLLDAPERGAIELMLLQQKSSPDQTCAFERILGFLSGVAITPGGLMPSQWLQPLLDFNGIVFRDTDGARRFMDQLMPLFNRVNDVRLSKQNLCPFDLSEVSDLDRVQLQAMAWGTGLHDALKLRPDIWVPEKHEVRHVPPQMVAEAEHALVFMWALAEPRSIPDIIPDPLPFQRNYLSRMPGWNDEMLKEEWDEELMEMFQLMCLGRLAATTETLQRYARAYDTGTRAGSAKPAVVPAQPRIGRNDPCPCGSGMKYKKCCGR